MSELLCTGQNSPEGCAVFVLFIFLMWTKFKIFIKFVTILLLFWFFLATRQVFLAPQPGIKPTAPCIGRRSLF